MKIKPLHFAPFLWIAAYLIIIDIAINVVFPYPKDPRNISPSAMQHFFDYGRSIEGKLTRMTRKTNDESAPILSAGWLDDSSDKLITKNPNNSNNPVVTIYGMSHAVLLAEEMARIDNSLIIRSFGAPGAVPSWSYASYLFDKEHHHSDIVILGIMTRGVPLISTTSGATNHFDSISPYTYPRFFMSNGTLNYILPPFVSLDGYREYFYNSEKWKSYINWLQEYDKYYDSLLFKKSVFDSSSIFRMLRRAYAYSMTRKHESTVYTDIKGFDAESDEVKILRSIIVEFSKTARRDNSLAIIYIVNNVFMGDRLFRILEPTLLSHNVLFLSSHDICPPDDPRCYDSTSHFIPSINLELAKAMIKIIRENLTLKAANKETKVYSQMP